MVNFRKTLAAVAAVVIAVFAVPAIAKETCTGGWEVEGYWAPIEREYTGDATEVVEVGDKTFNIDPEFAAAIKRAGWGMMNDGSGLGFYDDKWHVGTAPYGSNDNPLGPTSIAVDTDVIPIGTEVTVPDLPPMLRDQTFIADDVGPEGHQVRVFAGFGKAAEQLAIGIDRSGEDTVCTG